MNRTTQLVILSAAFGLTTVAVVAFGQRTRDARDDIPQDVLFDATIAQSRLRTLVFALQLYANDNRDYFPPAMSLLYPDYVDDPLVFWHPGDTDPPPTTIDNDLLNHPNSSHVSFEFADDLRTMCESNPAIWDNTIDNNAGYFINRVSLNAFITTDPPYSTTFPTRAQIAKHHLDLISVALASYLNDNYEHYPDDPIRLFDYLVCSPTTFWNPGDSDPEPNDITNSIPNAIDSTQISFAFLCTGQNAIDFEPDDILVIDNTADNNGGYGVHVVRGDFRVEFVPICNEPTSDVDGDGDVDLADHAAFQDCFSGYYAWLPIACKCYDQPDPPTFPDGDGRIDIDDFEVFLADWSGPTP